MSKTNPENFLEVKSVNAFYEALFSDSYIHGVRENALCELIRANKRLVEFEGTDHFLSNVILNEPLVVYIKYLLRKKELQTEIKVLSKILCK